MYTTTQLAQSFNTKIDNLNDQGGFFKTIGAKGALVTSFVPSVIASIGHTVFATFQTTVTTPLKCFIKVITAGRANVHMASTVDSIRANYKNGGRFLVAAVAIPALALISTSSAIKASDKLGLSNVYQIKQVAAEQAQDIVGKIQAQWIETLAKRSRTANDHPPLLERISKIEEEIIKGDLLIKNAESRVFVHKHGIFGIYKTTMLATEKYKCYRESVEQLKNSIQEKRNSIPKLKELVEKNTTALREIDQKLEQVKWNLSKARLKTVADEAKLNLEDLWSKFTDNGKKTTFKEFLEGPKAFYIQADYLEATKRDFSKKGARPIINYQLDTQYKVITIAKRIFAVIGIYNYPLIGISIGTSILTYKSIQLFAGMLGLLPAIGYPQEAEESRSKIALDGEWKYKRITVVTDGYEIDATIVGKASTLNNGRWVLASNGNAELYETKLSSSHEFKQILSELNGNAIVFNYPGVGASIGIPNKKALAKAYRAMLTFLEDQKNGIGAKEIIGYGHSIGGAVQGEALKSHELKKNIKYVFVKSRTFSELSKIASMLTNSRLVGILVKLLGWNLNSSYSSKRIKVPEIIMQTANVKDYKLIDHGGSIIDDGIIPRNASLAVELLDGKQAPRKNQVFIGMPEDHNSELINPSFLVQKIETLLKTQ